MPQTHGPWTMDAARRLTPAISARQTPIGRLHGYGHYGADCRVSSPKEGLDLCFVGA